MRTKKTDKGQKNARRNQRRGSGSSSLEARFRKIRPRLELLEARVVPSSDPGHKLGGPDITPPGLGVTYTVLSEQAHGVGLDTQAASQYVPQGTIPPPNPVTMAQFEAYLKELKGSLPISSTKPPTPPSGPQPLQAANLNSNSNQQDHTNQEGQPVASLNGPAAQLESLKLNPLSTGLSQPQLNPSILAGFDGMNFLDSVNGYVPPDTDMAVGPHYVMETVNAQVQIYDKATGTALLPNTPLNQFFNATSESPFDPVVTYDDIAGRFIVAAPTFGENMLLAVSRDSNPFDGFTTYDLNINEGGLFPDYPKIGFNADEVVVTFNMYSFFFQHVQILSFAASSIFTNPPSLTQGTDYFSNDRTLNDFTMAAATMHGATPGMPMYFVEENSYDSGSQMRVVSAANLLSSSPTYTDTVVNVDAYSFPPLGIQPGGNIQTNDTRILNAEWRDGLLVADQNVGLPTDSDVHARWYEFNVSGTPALVQDGTIAPAPGTSTYFPAITFAPGDVIGMVYNESSATEFPSVYDTGRTSADPAGTMETPALAHAGTATYFDFAFRWGDYSGISVDPTDGTIWTGAEYSTSLLSGDPANWATWISHYTIAPVVVSSSPAAHSVVTGPAPTTFSLTFSQPIDPGSILASSFTVDGTAADSASLSADGLTITYSFNTSPIVNQGSESMSLPAGAVTSAGIGNAAFSAGFFYVQIQLQVSATSPAVGSILTPPITDLVVQFNKAFDPYTITASDFQLSQGTVVSAVPLTSASVDLTLSGITQDGTVTLTVPAGLILDTYGVPNLAFSGTYIVQIPNQPYPTPLQGKTPGGSLIYDPTVTGAISFGGDTDSYTLALAAGQTLTIVMTTDPSLQGSVTVTGPGGVLGTATAASAGANVVLETVPVTTAGTYTITAGGAGGTTGNYTLQAILNAYYKQPTDSINTIGTAADLSAAFAGLGTTPAADRAGVVGTFAGNASASVGPDPFGYEAIAVTPTFVDISSDPSATAILQGTDDSGFQVPFSSLNASFQFSMYGQLYSAASDAVHNHMWINTDGWMTFENAENFYFYGGNLKSYPTSAAIAPMWNDTIFIGNGAVYYEVINPSGTDPQMVIEWKNVQGFYYPGQGFTFEIVLDQNTGDVQFNYASIAYGTPYDNGALAGVGIKGYGFGTSDELTVSYQSGPNAFINSNQSTLIGVGVAEHSDYYQLHLDQGQTATIAVKGKGKPADVTLLDASGNPLALGSSARGLDGIISDFSAPGSGPYYVKVTGAAGLQYDLVVTRGADFTIHGNSFNNAQPLNGAPVVLGSIVNFPVPALQSLDLQAFAFSNIYATDPVTGAFGSHIVSPNNNGFFLFGQNMASDGNYTYFNDGYGGSGTIYKLDPTGAVVATTTGPNSFFYTGLAYLDGKLYAASVTFLDPNIYVFDASTLAFLGTIPNNTSDSALVGLAGDPDRGVLWAVGQVGIGAPGKLYKIDPATGTILAEGTDNNQSLFEQDLAYANGMLIVSDTGGIYGTSDNFLDEYNPDTFAFLQRVSAPYTFDASGLAGDGIAGAGKDWYQFNVNAGDNLVITTTTPGGNSGNGLQFINDLLPTINLYDANGNLVTTATGNAGDGRNDLINWTALTSGSYRVQIQSAGKTNAGEYTISIQGASGGPSPFTVTSTSPVQSGSDVNFQPATLTVTVDHSTLLTSFVPADLTIDGQSATGVTVIDNHTLSFSLPAITDGIHNVSISGLVDIQGVALTPDSFSFITDTDSPVIMSSSLTNGAVLSPGNLTEVVTFGEAMNTAFTTSSAFSLYGSVRNVFYSPASFSWDPTGMILTINYNNLPSDAYAFNLYASGFQDPAGNYLASGLSLNFTMPAGTSTLSGLQPMQPLASLVYQTTVDNAVISGTDVDTYKLTIAAHQTLAVIVTPVTPTMTATVNLYSPSGNLVGTATSPAPGKPALLYGLQSSLGGTYQFKVSGGPGEYTIEPILNAFVDPAAYGGTPHNSIANAQPIDPYADRFAGHNDRMAVLGTITGTAASFGDALVVETGFSGDVILINKNNGAILKHYTSSAFSGLYLFDVKLAPDNTFYVMGDVNVFTGEIIHMDLQGDTLGTITSPVSDFGTFLSPEAFAIDPRDGTFWLPLVNSGNIIHINSSGTLLSEFFVGGSPNGAAVGPDGDIYITQVFQNFIQKLDPSTGGTSFFASSPFPIDDTWSAAGDLWVGSINGGAQEFNSSGTLINSVDGFGVSAAEPALSGNIWDTNLFAQSVNQFTSTGAVLTRTSAPLFQPGLAVLGDLAGEAALPPPQTPVYSFQLNQGQSVAIVVDGLGSTNVGFSLYDDQGNLLALSSPGATNYTAGLNSFVAPADGTYYVQVTGDPGAKYNLVVTRGADFTTQDHTTPATAQDITATEQSGDSRMGGALGYLINPSGAKLSATPIEGIDFNGSNCGCLPPDTNAAVGDGFIVETVNVQIRIYDTSGNIKLDEPLNSFFTVGSTAGDPYVIYDTIAQRWYVTAILGSDNSKIELAVSNDANPNDGFTNQFVVPVSAGGTLADFPKYGYNADALVVEANEFGDGHSVVTAIDKGQLLSGNLVEYQSTPSFQFRALVPAQMHGSVAGDPMWFMAATGDPTYDGTHPNTIRVTKMTNILSNSPVYTDYTVGVNTYGPNSGSASQPGGFVATNDVSTTQVDYLNESLVTAFSASTPADGFSTTKAHWYQVDVTSGTPTLTQEGLADPGPGVATFFPSATQDAAGNIGITYMESSSSEFVSAYVAGHIAGTPLGETTAGTVFAPGGGTEFVSFRNGDYSTVVLDPTDGKTFWAANEYVGSDGSSDIWRTKIAPFTVFSAIGTDFYSVNANEGDNLHFATTTPPNGANEFGNNFYPELLLYDNGGNLVATAAGNAADGRNSVIDFTVPTGGAGTWMIEVTPSPNTNAPTQGEYGLLATGATGALSPVEVTSTNPPDGALLQPPTDYIVTFSHSLLGTSLTPGELTLNGVAAIAVRLVDAHTVDWTIAAGSIPSGERVSNTAVLSADGLGNRVSDVSGSLLADFTSSFMTDNVPPSVTASSIAEATVFSPAPYSLSETVTFSEEMDTTVTPIFNLHGNYRNQDIVAASFSWGTDGVNPNDQLTINYNNLADDTYTLTLSAGGFKDLVGLTLTSDYKLDFAVALGTAAFPTPFKPVPPLGDLIYTGSDNHVLVTPTDLDKLTLALNAGESLTLVGTPTNSAQQLTVTVLDPTNTQILGSATAPAAGKNVNLQTVPAAATGTYTIQISDAGGALGLYDIQAYLNTLIKVGTSNDTLATAQDLTPSSYLLGPGNADRLAVLGSLPDNPLLPGQAFVSARYEVFYDGTPEILRVNAAGQVIQKIAVNDPLVSLSGAELSPFNNELYAAVTTSFNSGSVSGELLEFDPSTGQQIGVITLPNDLANNFYYYPYGFSAAADGTFWVPQPNSHNIIHVDANGSLLASFSTGTVLPESATVRADGQIYFAGFETAFYNPGIYLLNPSTGSYALFASQPNPDMTKIAASDPSGNGVWDGDFFNGAQRFDINATLQQSVGFYGSIQAQTDGTSTASNVWVSDFAYGDLFKFDQNGNFLSGTFAPGALGTTVWGVDNPNAPLADTQDFYSFSLSTGQSVTIADESLNGKNTQVTLLDGSGTVLATGFSGPTNVSSEIQNFIASSTATYYVEVTGDGGVRYSLTVSRSANFDTEPHNSIYTAQPLTGTNGVLGALDPGGTLTIGAQIEGTDFASPNNPCGCLPPDTNGAVGPDQFVEQVNEEIRVFDKATHAVVYDAATATFFNHDTFGDPYTVYDDLANRFYILDFTGDLNHLMLKVSNDSNFMDGFSQTFILNIVGGGEIPDYPKMGYNKDAIFVSFNDFGDGHAKIAAIDKQALFGGTLNLFLSTPKFQFRAMPPAQMHDDTTGGTEWFVSTDGTDSGGTTIRVTKMTGYLSNNPTFTYYSLPVAQYQNAFRADQPGGSWTTFPNTTTTQVLERNGHLVTAMASSLAGDGFTYPKGLYYQIDISSGTPTLLRQGVIDPGPGVAVQMPSVAEDANGNLGFTWMEGSSSEYVSMWVGTLDTMGHFSSFDAAPGQSFFAANFRIGDYSSTVVDPTDGTTFWSANEYIGPNGFTDIWNTHITSFSVPPAVNNDWYSVDVAAGNTLNLQSYTPSDQGGQFPNTAAVNIELYDTFGNLVATGNVLGDGRNESLTYTALITGQYYIHLFNNPGIRGEYFLSVNTATYANGDVSGEVYNDLNGSGSLTAADPGLNNWEVDLYDSNANLIASQLTHGGGNYDFGGLAPGPYTVREFLQNGWTETQPAAPYTYSVTVTAGNTAGGNNFGNFKNITIKGQKFNDLTGIGAFMPGDPVLGGWTIDLVNAAGAIVAKAMTDANGNYTFINIGPGTYTVQEELQPGWVETFPAAPGNYTFTATSGSDQSGLLFGNFQLVTFSGTVYNDLNGNGVHDNGEPGLQGWTINLYDAMGNLVASTTTNDASGDYLFPDIGPGQYTISEVHQDGWYQTGPTDPPGTYIKQAISSTNPSGLDFGNFNLVKVMGNVYDDLNGNGNLDPGDPGLQGWTINLLNPAGNTVATTTSDSNGNYEFDNLFPGTFTVSEVLQDGWMQTQPVNPTYYAFTTQSGTNETGLNFGNYAFATSAGTVYNDLNGNGTLDPGEPGIVGVTVELLNASTGAVVQSMATDSNGDYIFFNVGPGSYTIAEEIPGGYVFTQPGAPYTYAYNPTSGSFTTGQNFGNFQTIAVSGEVYNDLNGDGSKADGDQGIAGATVMLTGPSGTVTTSTDSNGNYSFTGIGPGSYTVQEVLPSGWIFTQPAAPYTYSFSATSGQSSSTDDFGNFQLEVVSGTVFNDTNDNHVQDPGEPGLAGVTIDVDGVAATTTDTNGHYSVSLYPGTHTVSEVIPSAYIAISPASGAGAPITAASGATASQNFADALPTATLDNGQAGYLEHGTGWTTLNQGWNGTSRTNVDMGHGGVYAQWSLPSHGSVASGTYELFLTYVPAASRGLVHYAVYDGSTLRKTVNVDQTQTPANGTYQGVVWLSLGKIQISSGHLRVRMTGLGMNATKTMDADGVLIIPANSGAAPAVVTAGGSAGTASTSGSANQVAASALIAQQPAGSSAILPASAATNLFIQSGAAPAAALPGGVTLEVIDQMTGRSSGSTSAVIDHLFSSSQRQNNLGDFAAALLLGDKLGQL